MLPLIHPTSVLVVDDDQLFLDSFEYRYRSALRCQTEAKPQVAVEELLRNNAAWKQHLDFLVHATGENSGDHVFQLRRHPLQELVNDPKRAEVFSVVIVDYSMPGMSGVDFCRAVRGAPARKIMLTGQAGESTAVLAFNEGLIDCFLTKQDPDLPEKILSEVERLRRKFFQGASSALGPLMGSVGRIFESKALGQLVEKKLQQLGAVECYFWDEPPGLLVVDESGTRYIFVVFDGDDMRAQLEIAENCKAPEPFLGMLRQGFYISWFPTPHGYYEKSFAGDWNRYVATADEIERDSLWISLFMLRGSELVPVR
jgi:CheY-like chemotaxis protein